MSERELSTAVAVDLVAEPSVKIVAAGKGKGS